MGLVPATCHRDRETSPIVCRPLAPRWSESLEGLTLQTQASESLYGGQFTSSSQLTKPNYRVKNTLNYSL